MGKQHGHACVLKCGASVFVYPDQYQSIMSVLKDFKLRSHQVICCEAFLPLIYHEIVKLPSKHNVKPVAWKLFASIDDKAEDICVVERSFYNSRAVQLNDAENVTQSTSEAHFCLNVRRLMLG